MHLLYCQKEVKICCVLVFFRKVFILTDKFAVNKDFTEVLKSK
jgi:hypothetical protein